MHANRQNFGSSEYGLNLYKFIVMAAIFLSMVEQRAWGTPAPREGAGVLLQLRPHGGAGGSGAFLWCSFRCSVRTGSDLLALTASLHRLRSVVLWVFQNVKKQLSFILFRWYRPTKETDILCISFSEWQVLIFIFNHFTSFSCLHFLVLTALWFKTSSCCSFLLFFTH